MKKTVLLLALFGLFATPVMAEEAEQVEPTLNSADALYGNDGRYSSLRTFHFNRGNTGDGYTRYAGRRFSEGRGYAAAYTKSAQRNAIRKAYSMYLNGQNGSESATSTTAKMTDNYLNQAEYSPLYKYHRNRFTPGYTRYEVRRHTTEDYIRRGMRLNANPEGRPAVDTLDYWRNTGRVLESGQQ